MKKSFNKTLLAFCIGLFLGAASSIIAGNHRVSDTYNNSSVQSSEAMDAVRYDNVYVNGTRYTVFQSSTGDIEVVR